MSNANMTSNCAILPQKVSDLAGQQILKPAGKELRVRGVWPGDLLVVLSFLTCIAIGVDWHPATNHEANCHTK